jgi:hypothetical protein
MPRPRRSTASSSTMDSVASSEAEKECLGCGTLLPLGEYSKNASSAQGHRPRCKSCTNEDQRTRYQNSREQEDEELGGKRQRADGVPYAPDLYVMALSTDPTGAVHGLKVGRSGNIPQRAMNLSASMPFTILTLATFPGAGGVEETVHSVLAPTRNTSGRGREWFHTSLPGVLHAVACAMQSQPIVNGGASTPRGAER